MKDATLMMLRANLKALKLSTMTRDMEVHLRQARESVRPILVMPIL